MSTRFYAISKARVAGYHADQQTFTRLYVESRVSFSTLRQAYSEGQTARMQGVRCACDTCAKGRFVTEVTL